MRRKVTYQATQPLHPNMDSICCTYTNDIMLCFKIDAIVGLDTLPENSIILSEHIIQQFLDKTDIIITEDLPFSITVFNGMHTIELSCCGSARAKQGVVAIIPKDEKLEEFLLENNRWIEIKKVYS